MEQIDIQNKIAELENKIKEMNQISAESDKKTKSEKENTEYALCLGGGGGKGAYQIGVMRACAEYGLLDKIKMISGSSIGSLNSILFALKDYDLAHKIWSEINMNTVLTPDEALMFNDKPGFMSRNEMIELIEKYIDFDKLKNSDIKLVSCIAYLSGENYIPKYVTLNNLSKDEIINVITASSAMPIVYESVTIDGVEYVDGGVADNIPVMPLVEAGYKNIIVNGLGNSKKNIGKWPEIDFLEIYPSQDLGAEIDGTLNFTKNSIKYKELLGYKDTLRTLKVYFEADPDYINNLALYEANDLREIKSQLDMEKAESNAASTRSKLDDIINKYDF